MSGMTYEQRIFNRLATVYRPTRSEAATIAKEADAEIAGLTASLASAQQRIAELERENRVLTVKTTNSLANNLCPDHRDKQAGKRCLACRAEELERALGELEAQLRHLVDMTFFPNPDDPTRRYIAPGKGLMFSNMVNVVARQLCASDRNPQGGDANAAPGRSPESAVATATRPSKGFLKGESPQATWPFAQDDKGTK